MILEARRHPEIGTIYGARYGVEGLINDQLIDTAILSKEDLELLKQTPGAYLGSSRKKLPPEEDPLFSKILATVEKHQIGYLLVNGGNDSMDTCARLAKFFLDKRMPVQVLGIPKTIDNDLALNDHAIGYPSAALHIINATKMIIEDAKAYQKGKIVLIEIMGRDTGWLTAATMMLGEEGPDLIEIPEMAWDEEAFLNDVKTVYERKGYAVCAISEGMPIEHLNDCGADSFGHTSLEGCCLTLARRIDQAFHISSRTIELSIPERADPFLVSAIDQKEAIACGRFAVTSLLRGEQGKMVCLERLSSTPYKTRLVLKDVALIAGVTKTMKEFVTPDNKISTRFLEYLNPLLVPNPRKILVDKMGIYRSIKR